MKKIRKIVALALATVMMMAMSITAFAAETTNTATLKINISGISTREESTINVYQVAYVDTTKNEIVVNDWAEEYYYDGIEKKDANWAKTLANLTTKGNLVKENVKTGNANSVEITDLPGGVYLITMTGETVIYNPMVVKAYDVDEVGRYFACDATATAKGESNEVEKTASDEFVKAGDVVDYTITSTMPYDVESFAVVDKMLHLDNVTEVVVKIDNVAVTDVDFSKTGTETIDGKEYTVFKADFSKYVDKVGSTLTISYKATVTGDAGYVNIAVDEKDGNEGTPTEVKGYTGDITLSKKDSATNEVITKYSAKFKVYVKDEQGKAQYLEFAGEAGSYKLAESTDAQTTDTIETSDGIVKVTGLEEGKYYFDEVEAPDGYSINEEDKEVEISDLENGEKVKHDVHVTGDFFDTTLIQLPFTGGMGTTIFTVLGVAIMAMAAALYFATKKKATK